MIETAINHLRGEMVKKYEEVGDLGNATVIALSQQLDVYLLMYQQQTQQEEQLCGED